MVFLRAAKLFCVYLYDTKLESFNRDIDDRNLEKNVFKNRRIPSVKTRLKNGVGETFSLKRDDDQPKQREQKLGQSRGLRN